MARAKQSFLGGTLRLVAGTLSAGGALVSILSYTGAYTPPAPTSKAHRLLVTVDRDTATAIGDSLQLAAVVTDDRGAALLGVAPSWSSADPLVAVVDQSGTVVSRRPGVTAIIVRVGELEARASIAVVQRAAALELPDSVLRVPEGERRPAPVRVLDARGHAMPGALVRWETADGAVAAVDSTGDVTGVTPGRTALTATFEQLRVILPAEVVPVAASITVVAGEDQRAAVGQALAAPVAAQIVSRTGRPIAGAAASFIVRGSIGAVAPEVDTSDTRGMVQAVWRLGTLPGRQQLAISVEGVAVSPVLTAEADPVSVNTRVTAAGGDLAAPAGDSLVEPVVVRVTDSAGAALADVPVAWSAHDRGAVASLGPRTDSLGEARARWTLGPKAGTQRLRVQVGNARLMPVFTVTAAALAGKPVSVVIRAGDRQAGTVGKALPQPVVLRAVDRHGNTVGGASIRVATSAGRLSDSLISTDSAGQAKVRWTLGQAAGPQRLTARLAGTDAAAEVTARARSASPASLVFVAPAATAVAGQPLPKPVMVQVTDTYGNPVPDRAVVFAATSGKTAPVRAVTDSAGQVALRWTLGAKAGPATLAAKVAATDVKGTLSLTVKVKPRRAP